MLSTDKIMEYNNNNTKSEIIHLQLYAHFRSVKVLFTNIKVCFMLTLLGLFHAYLTWFVSCLPNLAALYSWQDVKLHLLTNPVELLYECDAMWQSCCMNMMPCDKVAVWMWCHVTKLLYECDAMWQSCCMNMMPCDKVAVWMWCHMAELLCKGINMMPRDRVALWIWCHVTKLLYECDAMWQELLYEYDATWQSCCINMMPHDRVAVRM